MLDVVQDKIKAQGLNHVETLCCDLLHDDYKQKHDLIFCSMTLHHVQDTENFLRRFAELLKLDRYLAIADLIEEDGSFHGSSAEGIMHKGFAPEKLAELLTGLHMIDIKSDIIHRIIREEHDNKEYPVFLLTGRNALE